MVEAARTEAIRLISEDPELSKYPLLKQKVHEKAGEFHPPDRLPPSRHIRNLRPGESHALDL